MMDWLELTKYIAGLLPPGILGAVIVVIAGMLIHRSKKIPYKIVRIGVNGSTTITADALKANCEQFHKPLDASLNTLVTNQVKIQDKVVEISETVSFIKGQLSK